MREIESGVAHLLVLAHDDIQHDALMAGRVESHDESRDCSCAVAVGADVLLGAFDVELKDCILDRKVSCTVADDADSGFIDIAEAHCVFYCCQCAFRVSAAPAGFILQCHIALAVTCKVYCNDNESAS